ncbi:MAG: 2-polyprenyl-3-methyl-5-hydroxy-6-metoxy-1,4-benzoquinol methylase, partial [Alcanivorax sp.]|nr:2-polyprenyl-3-methyl-5-hydroxy-6-metoxy-1,4-benzoquinol methylase [Alcanivorax sp.]
MSDCRLCGRPGAELFASVEGRRYLRCPRCHLTFLGVTQLPARADEKAQYDLHRNEPDDPGYRRFLDQLGAPLCERLSAGARGLDFGCGPGPALARMLEERG